MNSKTRLIKHLIFLLILISIGGCSNEKTEFQDSITNTEDAMSYLRELEGE